YIATDDAELGNQLMDLLAMRGGILDDARAGAIAEHLAEADRLHARRCAAASAIAAFLARHPRIERAFHPSLPDHPDAAVLARDYRRPGSIVSFRVAGADEAGPCHIAGMPASTAGARDAPSCDGLAAKVNHLRTASEH